MTIIVTCCIVSGCIYMYNGVGAIFHYFNLLVVGANNKIYMIISDLGLTQLSSC